MFVSLEHTEMLKENVNNNRGYWVRFKISFSLKDSAVLTLVLFATLRHTFNL